MFLTKQINMRSYLVYNIFLIGKNLYKLKVFTSLLLGSPLKAENVQKII